MRKLVVFILFFIFSFLLSSAFADIVPLSSKSIKYYGIGLLNMPKSYTVYQYPYDDAKIIKEVNYENIKRSAMVNKVDMRKVSYVAYVPQNDIALLTVDLASDNDWYRVYIDQQKGLTGWVRNSDKDSFYTYRRLFYKYGKKYGIRFFGDLDESSKKLYSQPTKKSQLLEEVKYPKFIGFTIIQGNWLLANVNDLGKTSKIGWVRWRNSDGTLNMFPNFSE